MNDTAEPSVARTTAQASGRRSRVVRGVQAALSLVVIVLVARAVDWPAFLAALRSAKWLWLAIALGVFVLDRVLMAFKWNLLLRVQGLEVRLWEAWSVYCAASLAGTVLPSTVGADMLRAAWAWRKGIGSGSAIATFVVERAIGFLTGSFLTALGVFYLGSKGGDASVLGPLRWVALLAWAGGTIAVAASFRPSTQRRLAELLPSRIVEVLKRRLGRFRDAYVSFGARPRILATFGALTIAEQFLTFLMHYLIAVALGIEVSLLHFSAACAVAFFVTRLPISLDGLGVLEGALVVLLGAAGIEPAAAVALALLARILAILSYALGGAFTFFSSSLPLGDLKKGPLRG